jgi:hypothetical protein
MHLFQFCVTNPISKESKEKNINEWNTISKVTKYLYVTEWGLTFARAT